MSNIAIRTEGLSKQFVIGRLQNTQNRRFTFRNPFHYLISSLRAPDTEQVLWALKDVSLDVYPGETVGIIGKNGAGKSTLLKVLSHIIEPSHGRAWVNGRVGSLLEVGTGFHPELTGRENVFLNGAILGMSKTETAQKFDEIVAFAEVERFIDTPVKRYSSGMYVRLAFSVAAHLEPEILLVDEVLAVGDLAFQQKCLERIQKLTMKGMTILLVSHNMAAIQSSCHRAIYLSGGQVAAQGDVETVIDAYRSDLQAKGVGDRSDFLGGVNSSSDGVNITHFELLNSDGQPTREIRFGEPVQIRISLHAGRRIENPMINFGIRRGDGVVVCNFNNWYDNFSVGYIEGNCTLEGWLPPLRLVPDFYEIHALVWPWGGGHAQGNLEGSRPFAWVTFGDFRVTGPAYNSHDGVFQMPAERWRFSRNGASIEWPPSQPEKVGFAGHGTMGNENGKSH